MPGPSRRGKTYEEIYGPERAEEQRRLRSETNRAFGPRLWGKPPLVEKGTTYDDRFGDRAEEQRLKRRGARRGWSRFYSGRYDDWRKAVLARDENVCQNCGKVSSSNDAHHVIGWDEDTSRRFDVSNGRTLCRSCHNKVRRS